MEYRSPDPQVVRMRCLQATMSTPRHPTLALRAGWFRFEPCFDLDMAKSFATSHRSRSNLKTSSKRSLFLRHRLLGGDLNYPKNEKRTVHSSEKAPCCGMKTTAALTDLGNLASAKPSGYKSKIKLRNLAGRDVRAAKAPRRSSRCDARNP